MKLNILQWNVWYKDQIENIAAFIKSTGADICCLQELTIGSPEQKTFKNTPEYIADQLGGYSFWKEIPIESVEGYKTILANGIFSRFPITASRSEWINETEGDGGFSDEYRAYVEAEIEVDSGLLTVATTHMSYTHKFEETDRKSQEADKLINLLNPQQERYVFAGDLNTLPDSYTIGAIGKVLQSAGPDYAQKTWTTKPFSYQGFEETELSWRLDYVFTTPDIKVIESKILSTEFSDHLPILITVEL